MNDEPQFLGVAPDPRSEVEKAQDFNHDEIAAAAAPIVWKEKDPKNWRFFSKRNQAMSSSCMAQSGVKMLGVENFIEENFYVELSATPVYFGRANKPGEGMWLQDCLSLLCKPKACLEVQLKSQGLDEKAMNTPYVETKVMRETAEFYRANGYLFVPINMDKIASVVDQGKAVQVMMFFLSKEYWRKIPQIFDPNLKLDSPGCQHHGIMIADRFLYKGKKAFLIEDSAGNGSSIEGKGQRIVTEDFFMARCYGAGYLVHRKNAVAVTPKPKYKFTKVLKFGMEGKDVVALQDILKYEGLFDLSVPSTGRMLQITCSALKLWQIKHGFKDFALEPDVRKVEFGPKSIKEANLLYS